MAGDYTTIEEMRESLGGVHAETVKRMVNKGELPPFDIGTNGSKVKAWHRSTLEAHARIRRQSHQTVGKTG